MSQWSVITSFPAPGLSRRIAGGIPSDELYGVCGATKGNKYGIPSNFCLKSGIDCDILV